MAFIPLPTPVGSAVEPAIPGSPREKTRQELRAAGAEQHAEAEVAVTVVRLVDVAEGGAAVLPGDVPRPAAQNPVDARRGAVWVLALPLAVIRVVPVAAP